MPVKIPNSLPARAVLEEENIFVMTENRALHQDIRPLKLAILNLMPQKSTTETSLLRCLSNTPIQIEVDLINTSTYESKNTSKEYLDTFYKNFADIKDTKYDGLIITGAPVETLDFEDVVYWKELCEIMDWAEEHVFSTLFICWGAQAGLYHYYGVHKYLLHQKLSGVFSHEVLVKNVPLFRGYDDFFNAPHSRNTEVKVADILNHGKLQLLSASDKAGVYAVSGNGGRQIFILGHPEYEGDTLAAEYLRDLGLGLGIEVPENYFPNNDIKASPKVTWRSHAQLLYTNWLNYYVYQETPFDLNQL